MWMKYKTDFKKYWTSEVDKYKSISVEIKRSERADFVDCVLIIGPRCLWGMIYGFASLKLTHWATCWNLTDVTLADEDTSSILTDNDNRAIQGNVAMQVTEVAPSCGQIWI